MPIRHFLFVIFSLLFVRTLEGQQIQILDNSDKKLFLKFYFYQTNYKSDDYFLHSIDSLKYSLYGGAEIPSQKDTSDKMYVFKSYFSIDSIVNKSDLSVYIGTVGFPCNVFFNHVKIGRIGSYKEIYTPWSFNYHSYILPKQLLKTGKNTPNEICIQGYPKLNETLALDNIFVSSHQNVNTYSFW